MKRLTLLKRTGYTFVTLGLLCAAAVVTAAWRQSAPDTPEVDEKARAEAARKYHARIRDGVGREVELARGGSPARIRNAVESAAKFVERRSGVSLC